MIRFLLVTAFFVSGAHAQGWDRLFNGRDLTGWEHVGPGRVYVEDGLMKTEGGMGLLWYTRQKFGDCTLRFVYRTTKLNDNSGIFGNRPRGTADTDLPERRKGK